jgi:genome maintenance exonuclease 1
MAFLNIKYISPTLERVEIDGKRHYISPNTGIPYPSVTTVLADHGKAGLDKWRKNVGEEQAKRISYQASSFGTNLHSLCEAHILGEPLPKSMPNELQRFRILRPTIDERISDVYALETRLFSDKLKVAGQTDVIGKFDGINSVIDFKTSKRIKEDKWVESYWLQEAMYAYMWAELTRDIALVPRQLVLLISVEHENAPQILVQPASKWISKALEYVENYYLGHELKAINL